MGRRVLRTAAVVACLAGLTSLGAGVRVWWMRGDAAPAGPSLSVAPEMLMLEGLVPGETRRSSFAITNRSASRPVRLVGSEDSCDRLGCVIAKGFPVTIPPGETRPLVVEYQCRVAGVFSEDFPVYTDDPVQPVLRLAIAGGGMPESPGVAGVGSDAIATTEE